MGGYGIYMSRFRIMEKDDENKERKREDMERGKGS